MGLVVTCLAVSIGLGVHLWRILDFNEALDSGQLELAAEFSFPQAKLAQAMLHANRGVIGDALRLYAELEESEERELRNKAAFNAANAYLRRGLSLLGDENLDVALPMIELAKSGYRRALGDDPSLWDARFNLARALQTVPEVELEQIDEDVMPERSQRSLAPLPTRRELP